MFKINIAASHEHDQRATTSMNLLLNKKIHSSIAVLLCNFPYAMIKSLLYLTALTFSISHNIRIRVSKTYQGYSIPYN